MMRPGRPESLDLSGTDFSRADLRRKKFVGARARGAVFAGANLSSARLDGADGSGSDFKGAVGDGLKARQADFTGADFRRAYLQGSILDGADFSRADLAGADLKFSSLRGAKLEDARVEGADLRFCRGLGTEPKRLLRARGAKVSFFLESIAKARLAFSMPYILATLAGGAAVLGFLLYYWLSGFNRFSIPSLQAQLAAAKADGQFERALRIDQELLRRFQKRGRLNSVFNRRLDMAQVDRRLGRNEESVRLLEGLLGDFRDEREKIVVAKIELALTLSQMKNPGRVIELLDGLDLSSGSQEQMFEASLTLAAALRERNREHEAVRIYEDLLTKFRHRPEFYERARRELSESSGRPKGQNQP